MPVTALSRYVAACVLLALYIQAIPTAFADQPAENEIRELIDENGVEIYSNIAPMPTPLLGREGMLTAAVRSSAARPAPSGKPGMMAERGTPGIGENVIAQDATMPVENVIHELLDPQAPQDH